MILGLDFDNTIIQYDELFHKIAFEKGLVPKELPKQKNAVRDYLRLKGVEDEWTIIQGEVYGDRIKEAQPFPGMLEILKELKLKEVALRIISHKTLYPYLGHKRDLHKAAQSWLSFNRIINSKESSIRQNQVFFETTKQKKIERIIEAGCTHYLDDLPEILKMIPTGIQKILFSPNEVQGRYKDWKVIKSWKELPSVIK
jgi:FMN phosphatase YigB (HAD superfamily)|tara:strand:+ start:28 stop:624 length:597 start_codon:yes stop_codon:yes gene_type:complete